ncbi:hypothetical protein [Nocardia sp. NPDC052566]
MVKYWIVPVGSGDTATRATARNLSNELTLGIANEVLVGSGAFR